MTSPTQTKAIAIPAMIVYGTPTSHELTQASWFRAEDVPAAKAAAEVLKFSVIELQSEADRAMIVGVHEGVLKGSGRMIVGSRLFGGLSAHRRLRAQGRRRRGLAQEGEHRDCRNKTGFRTKHEF